MTSFTHWGTGSLLERKERCLRRKWEGMEVSGSEPRRGGEIAWGVSPRIERIVREGAL